MKQFSLGQNIRAIRKARGQTQAEFANEIGISRSYLSELEHDKRNLGINTVVVLADSMKVTLAELIAGDVK